MMGSLPVLSGSLLAVGKEKLVSKGIFDDNLPRRQCISGAQGEENWNRRRIAGSVGSGLAFDHEFRILIALFGRSFFRCGGSAFAEQVG